MDIDWKRQSSTEPLYSDILWNKPLNKELAGKLLVIIAALPKKVKALHETYNIIKASGVGEYRVVLPESAQKLLMLDEDEFLYSRETPSNSLSSSVLGELNSYSEWADMIAIVHDPGNNNETLSLLESFLLYQDKPLVITSEVCRNLLSGLKHILNAAPSLLVSNPKDFQAIIKELKFTFSLQQRGSVNQYFETSEKFIEQFDDLAVQLIRDETILTVSNSMSSLTNSDSPKEIHELATISAILWLHNLNKRFEATTTGAYLASKEDIFKTIKSEYS